ncbi:DUF5696 domain-containing protein [Anaerocolumna jejuensis]|uniref:DUF5696 domain-containing protein n=1 Tax=Anaerocolumna jejuensis TaxID=259063 RepID=UPI003F7C40D6
MNKTGKKLLFAGKHTLLTGKKVLGLFLAAIVLAAAGYIAYICVHYFFYNEYRKYLKANDYEVGGEFEPLGDTEKNVPGMVLAAENDVLKLYTDTETTEVAVYDKRTGETTYSNPADRSEDTIASGSNKVALNSQFMLTYVDSDMTEVNMYNYDYSVEKGQFSLESLKDGIRYTYLCGNLDNPTGLVPPLITNVRLEEKILSRLEEKEAKTFKNNYVESGNKEGFLELTKGAQSSKMNMKKLNAMVEKAGYTQADYDEDAAAASGSTAAERTSFSIPLEYRLQGDKLVVSIPTEKIKENGSGKITWIELLSYFSAGNMKEKGYLFVPNGSGSLINFNNGKKTERYTQYVYGMDEAMQSFVVVENTEKARMPVFGIKHENSAVFAEITGGEALSVIVANVAGNINSYNYAYPSFMLRGSEKVSMFGASGTAADLPVVEKDMYKVNVSVSYAFLPKEAQSYSGMADYYRKELIGRGVLAVQKETDNIPFYLDIVGGVKKQMSILGSPYLGVYPMTTFEEAGKITDELNEKKISDLRVNYLGWFNGGYYHDVATDIQIESKLGGKKGYEKLQEKLEPSGSKLYGDVAFQKVSYASDRFNYKMESAQYYSGYIITLGRVNPVTLKQTGEMMGYPETNNDILSPKFLVRHVEEFTKALNKTDISGISLRDLGETLPSDRRRTNVINREESEEVAAGQLSLLKKNTKNLMINGANAYSWGYASDLTNIPAGASPFYIVDEEVPFYQMVIHGCINYTGSPINLSNSYNKEDTVLHILEFGMSPHFILSYRESSHMKYTGLNSLYSTWYKNWTEEAADIYKETNAVLKETIGHQMMSHEILDRDVKKITYDNGYTIYINNSEKDYYTDGITIPAKGYKTGGEQK